MKAHPRHRQTRIEAQIRARLLSFVRSGQRTLKTPQARTASPEHKRRGNLFEGETMTNHSRSRAVIRHLSKTYLPAERLLVKIRNSHPDEEVFLVWCAAAEAAGLVGPRLVERYRELGSKVCEIMVAALEESGAVPKDPLSQARFVIAFAELRKRVTW